MFQARNFPLSPEDVSLNPYETRCILAEHFEYAHFDFWNGYGSATVGGCRVGDRVYYAISFCSPVDNFDRTIGRHEVYDNMIDDMRTSMRSVFFLNETTENLTPAQVFQLVLVAHLQKMRQVPSWCGRSPQVAIRNRRKNRSMWK